VLPTMQISSLLSGRIWGSWVLHTPLTPWWMDPIISSPLLLLVQYVGQECTHPLYVDIEDVVYPLYLYNIILRRVRMVLPPSPRPLHPWISRSDHPQIPRPKMASDPGTRSGPDPDTIWGHILGPIMEQILVLILVLILYAIYTYRIPGAYTPQYVKTIGTGCMCASVGALCGVYYVPQVGHQMGTPFGVISDPRMDPRSGPRMVPGSGPHLDHRSDTPDVP